MRRDPTEFRERFLRWKNGEQVYDKGLAIKHAAVGIDKTYDVGSHPVFDSLVVTPHGATFPSIQNAVKTKLEYDMIKDLGLFDDDDDRQDYMWYSMLNNNANPFFTSIVPHYLDGKDSEIVTNYSIPFIADKSITLTNAGLATGAKLSTNLLDSIADNAQRANLPLKTALGLATKESTLGNPTDDRSMRTLLSPLNKYALRNMGFGQHINSGIDISGTELVNYYRDKYNEERENSGEITVNKNKSLVLKAFEFYKDHPDRYNPGQKNYLKLVDKRGEEVWQSPEVQEWYKNYNINKFIDKWNSLPSTKITRQFKPRYQYGKDARKLEYHPEGDYYYGGNLFGKGNELVVKGNASPKLYMRPWKTKRDLRQEQNEYYYSLPRKEGWKRDLEQPLSPVDPVGEFVVGNAVLNPAFKYLFGGVGHELKQMATSVAKSNAPAMLYIRYPIGKILYGVDAKFPTIYRKMKGLPVLPQNGMVLMSNPNSRFAFKYTGELSPEITNFTYDAPVRSHSSGNWDSAITYAFPGKKLLGKNVISTEPSDLFTYGDNIKIPLKNIKLISGDLDDVAMANKFGYNIHTTPKLLQLYKKSIPEGRFSLDKENYGEYAKEVELETRKLFKSPTKKDVDFMNFVLQPKIKGLVYSPLQLDYLINNGIGPFGDRIGNATLRNYFYDSERWKHLLYDPATHAESNFRKELGIDLKNHYKYAGLFHLLR